MLVQTPYLVWNDCVEHFILVTKGVLLPNMASDYQGIVEKIGGS